MLIAARFTRRGQAAWGISYRPLLHAAVLAMVIATTAATLLKLAPPRLADPSMWLELKGTPLLYERARGGSNRR
jgi:hypothetical protein